jgi:four helix bundle protein
VNSKRPAAHSFRDLIVWQKAHQLAIMIHQCTADFPKREVYGLAFQMRRAAVSIPAIIAEVFRRRGKTDKVRFMNITEESLEECRYYFILSADLIYCKSDPMTSLLEEVSKLLHAYSSSILTPDS